MSASQSWSSFASGWEDHDVVVDLGFEPRIADGATDLPPLRETWTLKDN